MFGLFGKKDAPNESFNNILISTLGEMARTGNRNPTDDDLLNSASNLATKSGYKITAQQVNSIRCCSLMMQMSVGDDIFNLAKKIIQEIPRGEIKSANELKDLLCRHGVLISDAGVDFLNTHFNKSR